MSGLRPIHSVETITCVSERSGIASSGVRWNDRIPKPAATRTAITVRTGFRAHQAMSRSITRRLPLLRRRLELALGRDEEIAGGHDDLSGPEAAQHFIVLPRLGAEGHRARREAPIPEVHEDDALVTGVEHRALGNREPLPQ